MIKLITYTDDRMTISANKLGISAAKFGADRVKIYTPDDLPDEFKKRMAPVLEQSRGAGFYCWKPWVVKHALEDMTSFDTLIWSDAGTEWIQPINLLIERGLQAEDNLFFSNGWPHVEWCKMDLLKRVFPEYGVSDVVTADINSRKQLQASHFLLRATGKMKALVGEWLQATYEPGLIDNEPSILPNVPTFQEHRWDQSILCCLQIAYGLKLHWFPSTTGFHIKDQHPEDTYPAMFIHHRKRNDEWPRQ
jgi:hypothetical protein